MTRRSFKLLAILLLGISSGLLLATPIWERLEPAPWAGGHGEAIVGAGELVCLAHQLYANDIPEFACYDTQQERWIVHFEVPGLNLRNGTALAWDGHFIYILIGAREEDEDRKGFYRLNLGTQQLEQLEPTPHAQGAGDAIVYYIPDTMERSTLSSVGARTATVTPSLPDMIRKRIIGIPSYRCRKAGKAPTTAPPWSGQVMSTSMPSRASVRKQIRLEDLLVSISLQGDGKNWQNWKQRSIGMKRIPRASAA